MTNDFFENKSEHDMIKYLKMNRLDEIREYALSLEKHHETIRSVIDDIDREIIWAYEKIRYNEKTKLHVMKYGFTSQKKRIDDLMKILNTMVLLSRSMIIDPDHLCTNHPNHPDGNTSRSDDQDDRE